MTARSVLFIDHAPALGGAEHSLLMLLSHLDRDQWQPHLACADGPVAECAAALGIPVHLAPLERLRRSVSAPLSLAAGIRTLMHLSRDLHAELLVANTVRAAFYGAPAACLLRIPFVWHRRDFWLGAAPPYVPWLDTAVKRCLCAAATRLISNSEATARRHPCQHKVAVIPNGIEIQRFDPLLDGAPFRQAHGIASDLPVVGTVGRLSPGKRQDLFVRILADVQKAVPDVWAVVTGGAIFGEDAYATKLRHLAEASGIARRLVLTGQLPDPVHALAAMDIFVQPGEPEAFGLVNIEAMAMAKPVVAFRHGALPEIVVDGETGILVAPGDEAAMAEAILRLLHDPELRTRMGKAGRARVEKHFTIERVAEQVSEVFSRTLERPSSRNR